MLIVNTIEPQQTILFQTHLTVPFNYTVFKIMHHSKVTKFTPKLNFRIDLTQTTYVLPFSVFEPDRKPRGH